MSDITREDLRRWRSQLAAIVQPASIGGVPVRVSFSGADVLRLIALVEDLAERVAMEPCEVATAWGSTCCDKCLPCMAHALLPEASDE